MIDRKILCRRIKLIADRYDISDKRMGEILSLTEDDVRQMYGANIELSHTQLTNLCNAIDTPVEYVTGDDFNIDFLPKPISNSVYEYRHRQSII